MPGCQCGPSGVPGIPEQDQAILRDNTDEFLTLKSGAPATTSTASVDKKAFVVPNYEQIADYVDWRSEHPSDDLMSDLIDAEVEEPDGRRRRLQRSEVLTYISTIMGAGSETTTRLIGFTGQLLSDHADQRRERPKTIH